MIKLDCSTIGKKEVAAVLNVIRSGHLERGDITLKLEKKLKNYFGSKHAIITSNGTAALFVGLKAVGISNGDEVITTPFSFVATTNVVMLCGATPVFIDIDKNTFNIDVTKIEKKITRKTKAILVVDLYGNPAEYDMLRKLANKHKLLLISDSCQAIGAKYKQEYITKYADITVFSFFNSKAITSGEGGALLTNKKTIAERVNLLINHGQKRGKKYNYLCAGWNFRPTEIQSAIIITQLKQLDSANKKRRKNAEYLTDNLNLIKGFICPREEPLTTHVYSRYTIRVTNKFPLSRDELKRFLFSNKIEAEIVYPKALYNYGYLNRFKNSQFLVVEETVKQVLCLPIHQNLTLRELDHIIKVIKRAAKK